MECFSSDFRSDTYYPRNINILFLVCYEVASDDECCVLISCAFAAFQPQAFLIYAKGRPGMIKGLNLEAEDNSEVMIPITSLIRPTTLDYDVRTQFIYYADIQR